MICSSHRAGRTWSDLIAILFVLVFIVTIMIGAGRRLRDDEVLIHCARNLQQIGQGLLLYANEKRGAFPRTRADASRAATLNFFTGSGTKEHADIFSDKGPAVNDVTAAMYLICRTQELPPKSFVCPGTDGEPVAEDKVQQFGNFPNPKNLSYSMYNMYPSVDAIGKGAKWSNTLHPAIAIASDLNPGSPALLELTPASTGAELRTINSTNHRQIGQNVLYADGHAEFVRSPFCNLEEKDNIYTHGESGYDEKQKMHPTGGKGIVGPVIGPTDVVLLPAADASSPKPREMNPDESEFPAPRRPRGGAASQPMH